MRRLATALAAIMLSSPAIASGGLWCDVDDDKAKIAINSGMTRGMGGPLFNFEGKIAFKDKAIADDVRQTSYGHATQYWFDGKSLNLLLYWEREGDGDFASIEATIVTAYSEDEDSFEGAYEITVYGSGKPNADDEPLRYAGKISCGAE